MGTVLEKDDEPISLRERFAGSGDLPPASARSAPSAAPSSYFDREKNEYEEIEVEVLTLLGDVAVHEGERKDPRLRRARQARRQRARRHLLRARVWPTLELVLRESPAKLRHRHDPEAVLALIDPLG
jgi:predicted DNA-binding protein with PD1-like motif